MNMVIMIAYSGVVLGGRFHDGVRWMLRDNTKHGCWFNTWVFILRRYNGTYTQARGHWLTAGGKARRCLI